MGPLDTFQPYYGIHITIEHFLPQITVFHHQYQVAELSSAPQYYLRVHALPNPTFFNLFDSFLRACGNRNRILLKIDSFDEGCGRDFLLLASYHATFLIKKGK